jgi:ABC-type amino acid transport substrate-binding protein
MQAKRLMAAAMVIGLALAGCGGSGDKSTTGGGEGTGTATQIQGLVKPGTLILATTGNFPPFTMVGADGKVQGYSLDIGQEVADRLGLKFESQTVDFVAELQGLTAGKYDLADSGIWPTKERQSQFLFTVPVASTGFVATTLKGNLSKVTGLDDIKGLKVAAVQGSTREAWLLDNKDKLGYASYKGYPGASQALLDLKNNRIDLIVDDPLLAYYYIKQNPGDVTTAGEVTQEHPLSLALNLKATDVQTAVNKALKEMLDDGTMLKLQKKYWDRAIPVPAGINDQPPYPTLG